MERFEVTSTFVSPSNSVMNGISFSSSSFKSFKCWNMEALVIWYLHKLVTFTMQRRNEKLCLTSIIYYLWESIIIILQKLKSFSILTWRKFEWIIFPSSLSGCSNCLKWLWLIRMTWESLLVLTVKGWGILNITPISPNISGDPNFDKNWKITIQPYLLHRRS